MEQCIRQPPVGGAVCILHNALGGYRVFPNSSKIRNDVTAVWLRCSVQQRQFSFMSLGETTTQSLVMVITELDFGGAERAFVRTATGLRAFGWSVTVVSLRDEGPLAKELQAAGIAVTALNGTGLPGAIGSLWKLHRLLRQLRPAAVLSFLHQANLLSRLAAVGTGCRCVVSGIRVADRRLFITVPEWLTQKLVTHYVAVSEFTADVHARCCGIVRSRISTIRNGVDRHGDVAPADRASLGLTADDFVILFAGRLCAQKSPETLLYALGRLQASHPETAARIQLLLAGDGPLAGKLKLLAETLGLADRVSLMGWRSDLPQLMKTADLLVLPSRWEGLPNVILEAQASGLPVIASRVDGIPELITERATGLLFPAGDCTRLEQLLESAVRQPQQLAAMAVAARAQAEQMFSWDNVSTRYDALLRALVAGRASSQSSVFEPDNT